MKALRDNRHILDLVAKELLEKSRITGLVSSAYVSVIICLFSKYQMLEKMTQAKSKIALLKLSKFLLSTSKFFCLFFHVSVALSIKIIL